MSEPPTLEYGHAKARNRWLIPAIIALLVVIGFVVGVFLFQRSRVCSQMPCMANLRSIGQGLMLYANDYGGSIPPDFQTLRLTQQVGTGAFTCRSSNDTAASSSESLALPGGCSYIYVGLSLRPGSNPDCVAAFEDPANHDLNGAVVLFADGHVEWVDLPTIMQIINDLAAGKNPPSASSSTFTTKSAEQDYQANWQTRMPQMKAGPWPTPTTRPTEVEPTELPNNH